MYLINISGDVCASPSGLSEPSRYQRNEKLDLKISVFIGDITKLEIDAIVNAGKLHFVCLYVLTGLLCTISHPAWAEMTIHLNKIQT